ncbi:hypothetical protein KJ664_00600 [Patescibacteria group bacterium]|nr:hypothetical protein [Patescibacteria group bacterium]
MIKTGNISDINKKHKDWFLGTFVEEETFNTKGSNDFEVKWSKRKKGYFHPPKEKIVANKTCQSMAICVYGKFLYSFIQDSDTYQEYILKKEGDFIYWTPDINHKVEAFEDSLILTIRWYK